MLLENKIKLKSYSKINFALWIKNKRQDNFHELESLFYENGCLFDDVEVTFMQSDVLKVKVTFVQDELNSQINEEDNIAYKAAVKYLNKIDVQGVCNIRINKQVPVQAGLGGGSSNAGAVLQGLNQLFNNRLYEHELLLLANEIGSDVPFFIRGGTCLVTGKGEVLSTIENKLQLDIKVVKPVHISIPTKWAYEQLELHGLRINRKEQMKALLLAMKVGDCGLFFENMFNDFEEVIFKKYPELLELKNNLLDEGYSKAMLCGSGAAVFGIKKKYEVTR